MLVCIPDDETRGPATEPGFWHATMRKHGLDDFDSSFRLPDTDPNTLTLSNAKVNHNTEFHCITSADNGNSSRASRKGCSQRQLMFCNVCHYHYAAKIIPGVESLNSTDQIADRAG
ncbi:predicted protein [Plenodomus lingam JN3]|uniref:Predicted protein n=2 Tax=Leptosphaeria maculans TaxID=5022 RepID=E4ZXE6_LEPMJ|nr:predicted protein [Plenodomus lingam JN3]CBX95356.1 predicted protein [Plenodomus lingam JN3]